MLCYVKSFFPSAVDLAMTCSYIECDTGDVSSVAALGFTYADSAYNTHVHVNFALFAGEIPTAYSTFRRRRQVGMLYDAF